MVTLEQLRLLPRRYAIGKRPLSLVLGWGELTYTRIMDGNSPSPQHEAELRQFVNDPASFARRLNTGRERITEAAYKRSFSAVDGLLEQEGGIMRALRIYAVADRICALAEGDLTPSALHRLVYFAQGLALAKLGQPLFDDLPRAAAAGPEYDRLRCEYPFETIQKIGAQKPAKQAGKKADRKQESQEPPTEEPLLSAAEIEIIDLAYGMYGEKSGQALARMSRESAPWKKARKRASAEAGAACDELITTKSMKKYFSKH